MYLVASLEVSQRARVTTDADTGSIHGDSEAEAEVVASDGEEEEAPPKTAKRNQESPPQSGSKKKVPRKVKAVKAKK